MGSGVACWAVNAALFVYIQSFLLPLERRPSLDPSRLLLPSPPLILSPTLPSTTSSFGSSLSSPPQAQSPLTSLHTLPSPHSSSSNPLFTPKHPSSPLPPSFSSLSYRHLVLSSFFPFPPPLTSLPPSRSLTFPCPLSPSLVPKHSVIFVSSSSSPVVSYTVARRMTSIVNFSLFLCFPSGV